MLFVDEEEGFEFRYPSTWTLKDRTEGRGLIRADVSLGREVGVQARVHRDIQISFDRFVDNYQERFTTDMANHWKGRFSDVGRTCGNVVTRRPYRMRLLACATDS